MQGHFLKHVVEFLNHNDLPAVLDVYTPCQGEQGIADPQASRHARLAVESRMSPLFVHDPRRGADLHSRFSLEGNPDPDKDWTTNTIEYLEDGGALKLMEVPLTPADFALSEGRFRKQFRKLAADAVGVPIHEYVDLAMADRAGKTPFAWSTDADKKLVKAEVSQTIVHLVQERRKNWRTLQLLAGLDVVKLDFRPSRGSRNSEAAVRRGDGGARILDRTDRQGDVRAGRVVQRPSVRHSVDLGAGGADHAPDLGRASGGRRRGKEQRRRAG